MKKKMICLFILLLFSVAFFYKVSYGEKQQYLRDVATQNNFLIGASVSAYPFFKDEQYKITLKNEFNLLTIENDLKFVKIHPQRNTYNFLIPDLMVDFAEENDLKVRGHTLVWHTEIPDWLQDRQYSKEELSSILKNHIQTVVKHYKGKIYAWDVVNEAFNDNGTLRDSIWLRKIGPEYIELAFKWAHEADPNALLFYNDYGNEGLGQKSNAIFEMSKNFKERGVPIDGVGFQMHSSITYGKHYEKIKENFKRYDHIGLEVQITEMDVKIPNSDKSHNEKLKQQAEMYSKTLNVCLSSSNCTAFVTWGVNDSYSWIPAQNAPLLFDRNYRPKPSHEAIYKELQQKLE